MSRQKLFNSIKTCISTIDYTLGSEYKSLNNRVNNNLENAQGTWGSLRAIVARISVESPKQYKKALKKLTKKLRKTTISFPSDPNSILSSVNVTLSSLNGLKERKKWSLIMEIIWNSCSYFLFYRYIVEFTSSFGTVKPEYSGNAANTVANMEQKVKEIYGQLELLKKVTLNGFEINDVLNGEDAGTSATADQCVTDVSEYFDKLLMIYRKVLSGTSTVLTGEVLEHYEKRRLILQKELFSLSVDDKKEGIPYGYEVAPLYDLDPFVFDTLQELYPQYIYERNFIVPVFSPFSETNTLSVEYSDGTYLKAAQMINAHTIATLSHSEYPVESIICIDPHRRGTTFQNLLQFSSKTLPSVSVEYNPDRIKEVLASISEMIHDRITNKLGSKYNNFEDYNKENPADPIDLLIVNIMDFPYGFSNDDVSQLSDILLQGEIYGVMVTIGYNSDEVKKLEDIESQREKLYFRDSISHTDLNINMIKRTSGDFMFEPFLVETDLERSVEMFKSQMNAIFKERSKGVYNKSIILPPETRDCKDELIIPIGESSKSIINLSFGKGSSHHALIGGATGSGKSTLLHTIIFGLIGNYTPDDVNLYLLDFKNGTEFKLYDRKDIPHIKCLAIDAMPEFGESILGEIIKEMKRRSMLFKSVNQHNLSGFIEASGMKMPRIVLIIDEFQVLFERKNNGKIAANCARFIKSITTEGRSYGIHLIMSTQTFNVMDELTLSPATVEQMRVRIGMKCSEKDTRYLFKDFEESAYSMMKGPIGRAVFTQEYTEVSPRPLRVFYINDTERNAILDAVAERDAGYESNIRVFEGDRQPEFPEIVKSDSCIDLPVGEPVAIKPPLRIELTARRKQNVAIFGPETEIKTAAENLIKAGLAANDCVIKYIDGGSIDLNQSPILDKYKINGDKEIVELFVNLNEEMRKRKLGTSGKPVCILITDLTNAGVLGEVVMGRTIELDEFIDISDNTLDAKPLPAVPMKQLTKDSTKSEILAYFYDNSDLNSLDQAFAKPKTSFDSSMTLNKLFFGLLQDGPRFGIHFILTSDDVKVFKNSSLSDNIAYKLMFSLNENDAYTFLGDMIKCSTNEKVVYFRDGIKMPCLCKMYNVTE